MTEETKLLQSQAKNHLKRKIFCPELNQEFESLTNASKELKIRVEYGLAENINFGKEYLPKIDNGEITEDFFSDFFYKDRDGNLKYIPIDAYLSY
jgi:hypothetical protein